jgi:aminopeptidase N
VADIDNFYTTTIYEKGAEVLRMLRTLVGPGVWRTAMDLYFKRFDGRGVTVDDLLAVVAEVSGRDLAAFSRWLGRAGTPRVTAGRRWNGATGELQLVLEQRMADHQGGDGLEPLVVPVGLALFDRQGRPLPLDPMEPEVTERLVELDRHRLELRITGLPQGSLPPVASVLRGFSAPVILEEDLDAEERLLLLAHDTDPFNRWEAGQRLATEAILARERSLRGVEQSRTLEDLAQALGRVLADPKLDPMMKTAFLTLPGFESLAARCRPLDPLVLFEARRQVIRELAAPLREALLRLYHDLAGHGPWRWDFAEHGRRSLRNTCLGWLSRLEEPELLELARLQYEQADNMTDRQAALAIVAEQQQPWVEPICRDFLERYREHGEVVDAWLGVMARSSAPGGLERVQALQQLPEWQPANPNRVRAVLGGFAGNVSQFHGSGQAGYEWFAGQVVAIARLNAYVASGLARTLGTWHRYTPERAALLRACLERIQAAPDLPAKVGEVCQLALAKPA